MHNALVEREVPHELVPIAGRIRRPDRIAAVFGLSPAQVGRVVLLEGPDGAIAALVAADREPDPDLLARVSGGAAPTPVTPARATDLSGFLHEAIPPAGLPRSVRVVMDGRLADQEVLYFPGGEASSVLKIRSADLARAVDAVVAPIT